MTQPVNTPTERSIAIARLWQLGVIHWKLEAAQKQMYDAFHALQVKTLVINCARRVGKSTFLCCLAIEQCLQKPGSTVKYIAPTQKHVKMIIRPILRELFRDCPADLKPEFRTADNIYRFKNGSEIQLAGTDAGHAESLRGGDSSLCIIDEAGFCDDLSYIVKSILTPTTLTTGGKIILSSTPPKNFDHEFREYLENAESTGTLIKKTIYDALGTRITQKHIQEIIDFYGGEDSTEFRREFRCELIKSDDTSVVPEFDDILAAKIVKDWSKPSRFDAYVSGDIGIKDYTGFLFGYYDFKEAKLIIEDEVIMRGKKVTTDLMAYEIKAKEKLLWTNPVTKDQQAPYMRVCDNDLLAINNLREQNGILFLPASKTEKRSALNNLRIMIKEGRIIINPKCINLISHLKYATWNKKGDKYNRSQDHGHYDLLDCLLYMTRSVQQFKNPYPDGWGEDRGDNYWAGSNPNKPSNDAYKKIENMFTAKRSLRLIKR